MELAPLAPATYAALRLAVFGLRRTTRARTFPPVLHVGTLGGTPDGTPGVTAGITLGAVLAGDRGGDVSVAVDPGADHALRSDVVARLLELQDDPAPSVWLTRVGVPDVHDLDLALLAASSSAFAEAGTPLPWFVVVTKNGWIRPATGESRAWHRLRLR
jgi:hypothetical protein